MNNFIPKVTGAGVTPVLLETHQSGLDSLPHTVQAPTLAAESLFMHDNTGIEKRCLTSGVRSYGHSRTASTQSIATFLKRTAASPARC